jgi:hypothetical protein
MDLEERFGKEKIYLIVLARKSIGLDALSMVRSGKIVNQV